MSYNALLNAFAKMGTMTAARDVFCTMQRQGPSPDIISYNTLRAGYAQVQLPSYNRHPSPMLQPIP